MKVIFRKLKTKTLRENLYYRDFINNASECILKLNNYNLYWTITCHQIHRLHYQNPIFQFFMLLIDINITFLKKSLIIAYHKHE